MFDPTKRFSNRVKNYLKYRPRYPTEIISLLEKDCALTRGSVFADVGSGTGFLSELFLRNGNRVLGVEPNAEMRAAGERLLADYSNFISVDATAEDTTLPDLSVDFITAGQAFHWFDRGRARLEFQRILKPEGWVVIVWNTFPTGRSVLVKAYDDVLVRYGTDYREVAKEIEDSGIERFFSGAYNRARFDFEQTFDWEGFKGRLLSASYAPNADSADYGPMLDDLRQVFDSHQKDGTVVFDYDTVVYYGQLGGE
jgi:SAM-dependent methyltransferase